MVFFPSDLQYPNFSASPSEFWSEKADSEVRSCVCMIGDKVRKFSSAASQACILALDGIYFAGMITKWIPEKVTQSSLLILSGIGFTALPYNGDLIYKTFKDARFAYSMKNNWVAGVAMVRTGELLSNLGLLTSGFGAALVGFLGRQTIQNAIYRGMIPWSEVTLAVSFILTIVYIAMNQVAINQAEVLTPEALHEVLRLLTSQEHESATANPNLQRLAALVRASMDKDTLRKLVEDYQPTQEEAEKLALLGETILANMRTQRTYASAGNLAFMVAGYGLRALGSLYPNTAVSAATNLTAGLAYTSKMIVELYLEARQRARIGQIFESHIARAS
jgi:hypothetical protein